MENHSGLESMSILKLVPKTYSILKKNIPEFDFNDPPVDPVELSRDLADTMILNGGLGLSANQVGLPYRAFVISSNPVIAVFNPKIVHKSDDQVMLEEGCLSF